MILLIIAVVAGRRTVALGVSVMVLIAAFAASGHALSAEIGVLIPVTTQVVHVLGAGLWIGTLTMIWVVHRAGTGTEWLLALEPFSRVAQVAGPAAAITGLLAAFFYLDSWHALFTTSYGWTLFVKIGLLLGAAGLGAYNWRVILPALRKTPGDGARIRRTVTIEVCLGIAAIVATAVLVARPLE